MSRTWVHRTDTYYIHDESDVLRFKLAGSLSGAGVESIYQAWQTSLSIIGERRLVIDITLIVDADEHGRAALLAWHRSGARIIAASPESGVLAEAVLGGPVPAERIAGTRPKQSWLQRLRGFVLGCRPQPHRRPRFLGGPRILHQLRLARLSDRLPK